MSIQPILTFRAGICDIDHDKTPPKVKPRAQPGYVYLYPEDDLMHFCWRPQSAFMDQAELDLVMVPGDASFKPYNQNKSQRVQDPKNGRIFALKFSSSSQRHLFWMQSRTTSQQESLNWFSPRDLKLGEVVNQLLQGEELDMTAAVEEIRQAGGHSLNNDSDSDESMEDVEGAGRGRRHRPSGSGGAGPGATGGDIREEGEESREGGADGGRAEPNSQTEASALVQNFLASLKGGQSISGQQSDPADQPFANLPDLLPPTTTLPVLESADEKSVDNLLSFLPSTLLLLGQQSADASLAEPNAETAQAALASLSLQQKKQILKKVLHSPQFNQSLGSLTVALRDGGLPSVSDALRIKVTNGGFMRRGGMPLGGGAAVEAFISGVRRTVEEEEVDPKDDDGEGTMETD
ncbi:MAG: hypothetical protein M1825_003521 [Sarcosagium campestre]|nr:MAG: hypothetical protein M1825_003521 [Sarcosagium campestre]